MMPEEIKVGNVIFKRANQFDRNDKVRDKGFYKANVAGLVILLSNNDRYKPGVHFECAGVGMGKKYFTNKDISWGAAAHGAVKHVGEMVAAIANTLNVATNKVA